MGPSSIDIEGNHESIGAFKFEGFVTGSIGFDFIGRQNKAVVPWGSPIFKVPDYNFSNGISINIIGNTLHFTLPYSPFNKHISASVYNLSGEIFSAPVITSLVSEGSIDIKGLSASKYVLKVNTGNRRYMREFNIK